VMMLDGGLLPGEMAFEVGCGSLFDRLLEKGQALWFRPQQGEKLAALLPRHLQERLGARSFYAMGLQSHGLPDAMLFADSGTRPDALDESGYNAFKNIGLALSQALRKSRN